MKLDLFNARLLNVSDSEVTVVEEIAKLATQENSIGIQLLPKFCYKKDSQIVGIQVEVSYFKEKSCFLHYVVMLSVGLNQWKDFITSSPSEKEIKEFIAPLFDKAIDYARAIIASATKGSSAEKYYLPFISVDAMIDKIQILVQES